MRHGLKSKRARIRKSAKLMAEQSEFGVVAEIPPPKRKQSEFPWRKERLTKKMVPFTAGAQ